MRKQTAFALAGLGGFNAHGAGFLTAARERNVTPDLVTATSGQIVILAEWLRKTDLQRLLVDPQRPVGVASTVLTAATGVPGIFRPAIPEYWMRWASGALSKDSLADRLLPAQEYVPLRSEAYLQEVAKLLDEALFGVVFNAYHPESGKGVLFGNDRARDLLRNDADLKPITFRAVEAALWLSLYGFEALPEQLMDGAYHRPCVIAELQTFELIYAVRPLAQGWQGPQVPKNWFDVQDWQTEMWFSNGYKAEVAEMMRINKLIEGKYLQGDKYKIIELVEVTTDHPCGYFNFFGERPEVFDNAYKQALKAFREHPAETP